MVARISKRLDDDLSVQIECDYDPTSAQVLLAVLHNDVLEETVWRWRLSTTGEVADVMPGEGRARLPLASPGEEVVVLEPKECFMRWLLRWWLGWDQLHFLPCHRSNTPALGKPVSPLP